MNWLSSLVQLSETSVIRHVLTASENLRVVDKYQLQRRIDEKDFNDVYIDSSHSKWLKQVYKTYRASETNLDTDEEIVIKLERVCENSFLLEFEVDVYQSLADDVDISFVHEYLFECEYNVMMFDLLRSSLKNLFNFCDRRFSLKTMLMLIDQLLHRLEYIHFKNVIHRNIKSENFLMNIERRDNQMYVTDLSLVTKRRNVQIKTHSADVAKRHLIDTTRFFSINDHLDIHRCSFSVLSTHTLNTVLVQDRRDDLKSFEYMFLYLLRDFLSWQELTTEDQTQKNELILIKKRTISTENLCRDFSEKFRAYFDQIRSLDFDETSTYVYLRKIFRNLFVQDDFDYDRIFDWIILKYLRLCRANLT